MSNGADRTVIFDCDGVLIDTEVVYLDVEFAFLASRGVSVDRDWYVGEFMALAAPKWKAKLSDLLLEHTGSPLSEEDYDFLKAESRRKVAEDLQIVDGIHALLDRMTSPRAVASSTLGQFLPQKLERAGLAHHFGANVFSGDMVENGKPAPDLFLLAAERSTGMAPDRCIVVEDSANGVRGGKAAGMFTIGFLGGSHVSAPHGDRLKAAGADLIIEDHDALSHWLASQGLAATMR